jgi:hypothetical protein
VPVGVSAGDEIEAAIITGLTGSGDTVPRGGHCIVQLRQKATRLSIAWWDLFPLSRCDPAGQEA